MREKLIELNEAVLNSCLSMKCSDCAYSRIFYPKCMSTRVADTLISNGVTIQDREIDLDYEAED